MVIQVVVLLQFVNRLHKGEVEYWCVSFRESLTWILLILDGATLQKYIIYLTWQWFYWTVSQHHFNVKTPCDLQVLPAVPYSYLWDFKVPYFHFFLNLYSWTAVYFSHSEGLYCEFDDQMSSKKWCAVEKMSGMHTTTTCASVQSVHQRSAL